MKNKLLAIMMLFMISLNGQELSETESPQQFTKLTTILAKAEAIDNFFLCETLHPQNGPLRDLKRLFPQQEREEFFFRLVLDSETITSLETIDIFIRSAATSIIQSSEYRRSPFSEEGINPFFYLIEELDPVCRTYMRRAREQK